MRFLHRLALLVVLLSAVSSASFATNVIFLNEQFDGSSAAFRAGLAKSAAAGGFRVIETSGTGLAGALAQEKGPGAILVLPDGRYLPVDAKQSLPDFLKRGNHLLMASGPALSRLVLSRDGKWFTKDGAKADLANLDGATAIDFSKEDLTKWARYAEDPGQKTAYTVEQSGDPRVSAALHVAIGKLSGWELYAGPGINAPLPADWAATTFWAKGGPNTPEVAVEWHEKDGARWMTIIKLTPQWKQYVLLPEDFKWWANKPVPGRGDAKDRFKPDNASAMAFGVSNGVTHQDMGIAHDYWISNVKVVRNVNADVDFTQPVLETLSPTYKTYGTYAIAAQRVSTGQETPVNDEIVCPVPRSRGITCNGLRRWRYLPIMRAVGKDGEIKSSAVHMFLNNTGDYAGSVFGFLGFSQTYLERNAKTTVPLAVSMLKRMEQGIYLANAGTDGLAYAQGENVKTGAYVSNLSLANVPASVEFTILSGSRVVEKQAVPVNIQPASQQSPQMIEGRSRVLPAGDYTVKTALSVNGRTVDAIVQEFRVIRFSGQDQAKAVSVADGVFKLAGKTWRPIGANYWQRDSAGQEMDDNGLKWLSPEQYDPEVVEQDFTLMQKLGMTAISIAYTRPNEARNVMDVLARAEKHGLKVNVYIEGLHPLNHDFDQARALIEAAHLPESPAVFAYDCGWEVQIGTYNTRKHYDGPWQDWVIKRYGSIEAAEKDWGFKPERRDGRITGANDDQLKDDGPWRIYVAAYRRFWDDEISKNYAEVRAFIRSLDKYHLVGARSGYGGCGNPNVVHMWPFDLASGAKHLDFVSPEALNVDINDMAGFLRGGFTALYGQLVSGGKPVFWAESGRSIWPECDAEKLELQRQSYSYHLQTAYDSFSGGSMAWWWPGGYRRGEESDYGIVNPDGSPRASALEIAKMSGKFQSLERRRQPDTFIAIDRDKYTKGYAGLFMAYSADYRKAVAAGKVPALRTEGTGTTSADTPLVAVGNAPYNGHNPPKYLNSEFGSISINGIVVKDGGVVEVERAKPVYVEASVANTGEAKWLAPKGSEAGGVYLVGESGAERFTAPIVADTPFMADASVAKAQLTAGLDAEKIYTFRMTAKDRADFGDVVRVTVRSK